MSHREFQKNEGCDKRSRNWPPEFLVEAKLFLGPFSNSSISTSPHCILRWFRSHQTSWRRRWRHPDAAHLHTVVRCAGGPTNECWAMSCFLGLLMANHPGPCGLQRPYALTRSRRALHPSSLSDVTNALRWELPRQSDPSTRTCAQLRNFGL